MEGRIEGHEEEEGEDELVSDYQHRRTAHRIPAKLGVADGMSVARVWTCQHSKRPPRRCGHFKYRRIGTHAIDMPSATPMRSTVHVGKMSSSRTISTDATPIE